MGLFFEFLLSMESMEPGQLSITLYSVCKIQILNTESPPFCGCWVFLVLLIPFCQSGSRPSSFLIISFFYFVIQVLEAYDSGGWF